MSELTYKTYNGTKGVEIVNVSFCKMPLSRSQVQVEFSKEYNNKTNDWIEDSIELIWNENCKKNCRLYNQSKFRYAKLVNKDDGHVVLKLGITTYKELIGTNCHSFGKELVAYGEKHFNCSRSCLANPLGVGALLLTKDGKFIFLKRALWTGEDKGLLDRPGGHPEPSNVSTCIQTWTEEECKKLENKFKVREEIFDSVKHEIRDEVNLPIGTLEDPLLLGIVRSLERLGRPSAEFLVLWVHFQISRLYSYYSVSVNLSGALWHRTKLRRFIYRAVNQKPTNQWASFFFPKKMWDNRIWNRPCGIALPMQLVELLNSIANVTQVLQISNFWEFPLPCILEGNSFFKYS